MTESTTTTAEKLATTDQEKPEHPPIIRVEDAGPARKKLVIEISPEAIAAKLEENFGTLRDEAAIPGFRRGYAPQKLLEKRFGEEVRKDVCNQLVGDAYTKAVEEHGLRVLGEPDLKDAKELKLPETGSLVTEIEVEVVPDFKLPNLKGLEVSKPALNAGEAQIDAEIERTREMYGQFKPVDVSKHDDYMTANVTVLDAKGETIESVTGAEMLVPGKRRKFKGAVAGILVEELGKTLEGKKPGDKVEIHATGPARHENEKIAGHKVKIEVVVTQVRRLQPLSVEELVGAMGVKNEAELRKQFALTIEAQAKNEQTRAMHQQLLDALSEKVKMELPEKVSARQAGSIVQRRAMELLQQGVSKEDIEQHLAELREASGAQAKRDLKQLFILDAVARELEVEVSEPEVNGRIAQIAQRQGVRPERLRDQLYNSGQLDQLYIQIREQKALAKLLGEAKIVDAPAAEKPAPKKKAHEKDEEEGGEGEKPEVKKKTAAKPHPANKPSPKKPKKE